MLCFFFQMEEQEQENNDGAGLEIVEKEETETNAVGSEEMELNIAHIFQNIEHFTQRVTFLNYIIIWRIIQKMLPR